MARENDSMKCVNDRAYNIVSKTEQIGLSRLKIITSNLPNRQKFILLRLNNIINNCDRYFDFTKHLLHIITPL